MEKRYYTVEEVSKSLGVSKACIYDLIRQGEVKAFKICKLLRISDQSITEYLEKRTAPVPPEHNDHLPEKTTTSAASTQRKPETGKPETIIVTRHPGAVEWLNRRGIYGKVLERANRQQVYGKIVYGIVPLFLAHLAAEVRVIEMPYVPSGTGINITADEMDLYGAQIVSYKVIKKRES